MLNASISTVFYYTLSQKIQAQIYSPSLKIYHTDFSIVVSTDKMCYFYWLENKFRPHVFSADFG